MVTELGCSLHIEELFLIRKQATQTLVETTGLNNVEISSDVIIGEVYHRLKNSGVEDLPDFKTFNKLSEIADVRAEQSIVFPNEDLITLLQKLKDKGNKVYLISDFYLSDEQIMALLETNGIGSLFSKVYVSSSLGLSKLRGNIYPYVLEDIGVEASNVIMIGDSKRSDFKNSQEYGIEGQYLPHLSHKVRNKLNLFGDHLRELSEELSEILNQEVVKKEPLVEYIVMYYYFTERLYAFAKVNGIKNLFFLAREGLFLKTLFDLYQEKHNLDGSNEIKTHYLKASRKSAMHASLKPLDQESFETLRHYDRMSISDFLKSFFIDKVNQESIAESVGIPADREIVNFTESEEMDLIKENKEFQQLYESHRKEQRTLFETYLASFGVDFEQEPLVLVDIGWGGSMQESISKLLKGEKEVWGLYLGLKHIYNITNKTPRWGLLFSVYPYADSSDQILMANRQMYEQLAAAPHGSIERYTTKEKGYTHEVHERTESEVYDSHIAQLQDQMLVIYSDLLEKMYAKVYNKEQLFEIIVRRFLKLSLLPSQRKYEVISKLSDGFYQNIGSRKVGLNYKARDVNKIKLIKKFIIKPEYTFPYLVKIGPYLYEKNKYILSPILYVIYFYILFNFRLRNALFGKELV